MSKSSKPFAKSAQKFRKASRPNSLVRYYEWLLSFDLAVLFSTKHIPGPPRTIYVNRELPPEYLNPRGKVLKEHVHISNQVITSKYNILTFLPRNLLEQFRRVANIFFLSIAILQFFPQFSTITPAVVILPLAFIVLVTALKDGYEDYGRHQADRRVNHSITKVLSHHSGWQNPNGSKSKTKTFTRRLMLQRSPKVGKREHDFDYDSASAENHDSYGHDRPHWKRTLWEDVRVGDFVKLHDGEGIPADILICSTSEDENVAFVETKNLDGETNLKSRNAVSNLTDLRTAVACTDKQNDFTIGCDRPDTHMYRLNAAVDRDGKKAPVDAQTILLRGTVLRNTDWVIGVVLFTGEDSKIVLNSGGTPSKRSKVERQMNPQVLLNLLILALMCTACAIGDSTLEKVHYPEGALWLYGANTSDNNPSINGIITWAFALLTFQNIVPISLYISIEVVRTLQSAWIYFDYDIYYSKTDRASVARSWNLTDDLGQIEYILSDKTGTLTQNVMVFRQCSIGGVTYAGDVPYEEEDSPSLNDQTPGPSSSDISGNVDPGIHHFQDAQLQTDIERCFSKDADQESAAHARHLNGFFSVLALCHTVLTSTNRETGAITYKAQSPDEQALVQAAADVGFVYKGRDSDLLLTLSTPFSAQDEKYELLNILEFSSARKRMSVIVRQHGQNDGDSRIFLLSKGADNVIFERLKPGNDDMKKDTEEHLAEFATKGLRTLTLAYKVIGEEEYALWNDKYHEATVSLDDREARLDTISEEMEINLRLLGATAIEDRLQDGVPEAIADLKLAGIKIWVLTGDKLETAIAIGRSTNLISTNNNLVVLRGHSKRSIHEQMIKSFEIFFPDHDVMDNGEPKDPESIGTHHLQRVSTGVSSIVGDDNGNRPGGMILVIDGAGLLEAFEDEMNKDLLLRLGTMCEGVICCRVSPLQKALVVRLVKDGLGAMTLAIGDGANDVSMIQAADVGVGIAGEEGLQAVNSSDYAIAQFRFLKKLLLVHGHWSYARNGIMIATFFYKNIIAVGILWWFQIWCGWSANYVFSYYYLLLWNSVWTLLPVVGIGLFDRIADYHDLMAYPELYRYGREGSWFNYKICLTYMVDGLYQSVAVYFFIQYSYAFSVSSRSDGYDVDQAEFSTTMAIAAVMIADLYTGFASSIWTGWHVFAVWLGIIIVWIFTAAYSAVSPSYSVTDLYGNHYLLFTSAYFWLCLPLTFIIAVAPRYFYKAYNFIFHPGDLELVRMLRKKDPSRMYDLRCRREDGYPAGFSSATEGKENIGLKHLKHGSVTSSRRTSRTSLVSGPPATSVDVRSASRTDMSTGLTSVERGFGFAMEEPGAPHLRRIQTDLSERRVERGGKVHGDHHGKGKGAIGRALSLGLKGRIHRTQTHPGDSP